MSLITTLVAAIQNKDLPDVNTILELIKKYEPKSSKMITPLCAAAEVGFVAAIEPLMTTAIALIIFNNLLRAATESKQPELVDALIKQGANHASVLESIKASMTTAAERELHIILDEPLRVAAVNNQPEFANALIAKGANRTSVLAALASLKEFSGAKLLLREEDKQNNELKYPLIKYALEFGNLALFQEMLAFFNVDITKISNICLYFAVKYGYVEIAKYLLLCGANPNVTFEERALFSHPLHSIGYLHVKHASPTTNAPAQHTASLLSIALKDKPNFKMVELLIDYGANITQKEKDIVEKYLRLDHEATEREIARVKRILDDWNKSRTLVLTRKEVCSQAYALFSIHEIFSEIRKCFSKNTTIGIRSLLYTGLRINIGYLLSNIEKFSNSKKEFIFLAEEAIELAELQSNKEQLQPQLETLRLTLATLIHLQPTEEISRRLGIYGLSGCLPGLYPRVNINGLMTAVNEEDTNVLSKLLPIYKASNGQVATDQLLEYAVINNKKQTFKILLEQGANPHLTLTMENKRVVTLLYFIASGKNREIYQILMAKAEPDMLSALMLNFQMDTRSFDKKFPDLITKLISGFTLDDFFISTGQPALFTSNPAQAVAITQFLQDIVLQGFTDTLDVNTIQNAVNKNQNGNLSWMGRFMNAIAPALLNEEFLNEITPRNVCSIM